MTKWLAQAGSGTLHDRIFRGVLRLLKVFPSLTVGNRCITLGVNIR